MKNKMKKALALVLALVMCFGLIACGGPGAEESKAPTQSDAPGSQAPVTTPDPTVKYKDTVVIAYTSEIANGAPYFRVATQDRFMTVMTHDTLCLYDMATGEVKPSVAKSWKDVNGDGKVWEITLEEGVQFHDGEGKAFGELTAADVKFTFEYAGAGGTGEIGYPLNIYSSMESIDVVSTYVVRFTLNTAMYDFPSYLTGDAKLLCAKAFETYDDVIKAQEVGCGPYYLDYTMSTAGVQWTVTRFDEYWGGVENHPTKHIVCRLIPDQTTLDNAVQTGEVDLGLGINALSIPTLEAAGKVVNKTPGSTNIFLAFNYHNVFEEHDADSLKLRQAISYAVDKDAVIAVYTNGANTCVPSNNFAVSAIPGYVEMDAKYAYNVAEAQKLMKELGYSETNRLSLKCAHYAAYAGICTTVQALLKEVYIDVEPVLVDGSNFAAYCREGQGWDIALNYASMGGAMFYDFNRFLHSEGSTRGLYGWASEEYDALQAAAMNAGSYEKMGEKFAEIQHWVAEQLPYLPLMVGTVMYPSAGELEGLVMHPSIQLMNLSTLRIPE